MPFAQSIRTKHDMTRRRPSLVTESPLQVWLARRTAWKRDLLSGAERLNNWLAARDELPLVEIGRELGLPLQMGLESGILADKTPSTGCMGRWQLGTKTPSLGLD